MTASTIDWTEVQRAYMAGAAPRHLAKRFGLSPKQIRNIVTRQGWYTRREEIRTQVAEEMLETQRELSQKAMAVLGKILDALLNADGSLNWHALDRIPSPIVRAALTMALPAPNRIKEVIETYNTPIAPGTEEWTETDSDATDEAPAPPATVEPQPGTEVASTNTPAPTAPEPVTVGPTTQRPDPLGTMTLMPPQPTPHESNRVKKPISTLTYWDLWEKAAHLLEPTDATGAAS